MSKHGSMWRSMAILVFTMFVVACGDGPTAPITNKNDNTNINTLNGGTSTLTTVAEHVMQWCPGDPAATLSFNASSAVESWTSTNTDVAKVDQNGDVTSVSNGKTTIIARFENGAVVRANITVTCVGTPPGGSILSVVVNPHTLTLNKDQSGQLRALVTYTGVVTPTVRWASRNPNCVIVTASSDVIQPSNGWPVVVTAGSAGCSAWIVAAADADLSKRDSALVTVLPAAVATVTIPQLPANVTNCTGFQMTYPLTVNVNGVPSTGTWSSSNQAVATVNSTTGVVTLTGSVGSAVITVNAGGGQATWSVTVTQCAISQPATITLTATPTAITQGGSSILNWTSQNCTGPLVASGGWSGTKAISGSEVVTPTQNTTYSLSCPGATGNALVSVTVTVNPVQPNITVTVTPPTFTCTVGGTQTFTAVVSGTTAGQSGNVTWSSSDVTVMSLGQPTNNGNTSTVIGNCLKVGTATVRATAVADVNKSGVSNGTILASYICTFTSSVPAQANGTYVFSKNQVVVFTASNPNCQFPYWKVDQGTIGTIKGDGTYTDSSGITYTVGRQATFTATNKGGTINISAQAAIVDVSTIFTLTANIQ